MSTNSNQKQDDKISSNQDPPLYVFAPENPPEPEKPEPEPPRPTGKTIADIVVDFELAKLKKEEAAPPSAVVTKKRFNIKLVIVLALLATLAVGAFFLIKIIFPNTDKGSGLGATQNLECTSSKNSAELLNLGNALDANSALSATYDNGKLLDLKLVFTASFEDSATANISLKKVHSDYIDRFKSANLATDPFESEYNHNGNFLKVTHYVRGEKLNKNTAPVIHLSSNQYGVVISDANTVKNTYEQLGYTCVAK